MDFLWQLRWNEYSFDKKASEPYASWLEFTSRFVIIMPD